MVAIVYKIGISKKAVNSFRKLNKYCDEIQ